jgi:putative flippase GtrA
LNDSPLPEARIPDLSLYWWFCCRSEFYCAFILWIDCPAAVILGYLTGMVVAFVLMRTFVFPQSSQPVRKSIIFFVMVNSAGILQTFAVSMGLYYLLPLLGVNRWVSEIAHGIGIAVPAFSSYIGHKRFSFK